MSERRKNDSRPYHGRPGRDRDRGREGIGSIGALKVQFSHTETLDRVPWYPERKPDRNPLWTS